MCFEVLLHMLVHNLFDSKVLNAICVSLNSCYVASFSSTIFCVGEALRFSG